MEVSEDKKQIKFAVAGTIPRMIHRVSCLMVVVSMLMLIACSGEDFSGTEATVPLLEQNQMAKDSLAAYLPGGLEAESRRDSLIVAIFPILIADPSTRPVQRWHEIRSGWEHLFGSGEEVATYTMAEAARLLDEGQVGMAAKLILASGKLCNIEGNHLRSTDLSQQAYELAYEVQDSSVMGWALTQMSLPLVTSGDSASAMRYLRQAMDIALKTDNYGLQANLLINIGAARFYTGDSDGSLEYNYRSRELSELRGIPEIKKISLLNIGYFLNQKGESRVAIQMMQEELDREENKLTAVNSLLHWIMFEGYLSLGEYDKAEAEIRKTCEIADALDYAFGIQNCKTSMAKLYEAKGDMTMALKYNKEYHAYQEESLNSDARKNLRSLQIKQLEKEHRWNIARLEQQREQQGLLQLARRDQILTVFIGMGLLAVFLLVYLQARNKIKQIRVHKETADVKLQFLREQMNPHFIFNAINGIQNQILKSNKIEAYGYLGKFAELLRMITKRDASMLIDLEDEVQFLGTYLDLEKLRFRDQFTYELDIEESLINREVTIPSMMIQPFVENAIVHGFSLLPRKGKLEIIIRELPDGVKCIVRDNGRGRAAAGILAREEAGSHLSMSSANTTKRAAFLRDSGYPGTNVRITDLFSKGEASGTEVTIILPFMEQEK